MEIKINDRFGKLVVKSLPYKNIKNGKYYCKCLCDCGKEREVRKQNLVLGRSRSCGCVHFKHGMCVGWTRPEVSAFLNARCRCVNPKREGYKNYGGRGIKFLYSSFEEFYKDVGERPSKKHSLDRIDTNGNYEVGNCRWATAREQALNKRVSGMVFNGERVSEAAKRLGCSEEVLYKRKKYGWPIEKIFMTPVKNKSPHKRITNV